MAATETAYRVLDLEEAALAAGEDNRRRVPLRRDFDIAAFGVNAIYQAKAGEPVIGKPDEISPFAGGHEELYVVLKGACKFSVEGDEIDAPAGTAVFVRDPAATRSSVATEDGTIVLAVGGKPGEAYRAGPLRRPGRLRRGLQQQGLRTRGHDPPERARGVPGQRGAHLQPRVHGSAPRQRGRRARAPRGGGGLGAVQGARGDR